MKKVGTQQLNDVIFKDSNNEYFNPTVEIWEDENHYWQVHRETSHARYTNRGPGANTYGEWKRETRIKFE